LGPIEEPEEAQSILVSRILRGTEAADLPVQAPTKFELVSLALSGRARPLGAFVGNVMPWSRRSHPSSSREATLAALAFALAALDFIAEGWGYKREAPPQIADFFTGSSHSGSQRAQKIQSVHGGGVVPKFSIGSNGKPMKASANDREQLQHVEIKVDHLIDDMRLLRSQIIAFNMHLKGIEAYLKAAERSERRREGKSRPRFAAAASATARTVLVAVGAAIGATVLLYLATWADNGMASALMLLWFGGVGAAQRPQLLKNVELCNGADRTSPDL
jgi:hypothetical protein